MPLSGSGCASSSVVSTLRDMQAHDASNQQAPRARAVALPVATSPEVASLFAGILLLALLVLLL